MSERCGNAIITNVTSGHPGQAVQQWKLHDHTGEEEGVSKIRIILEESFSVLAKTFKNQND